MPGDDAVSKDEIAILRKELRRNTHNDREQIEILKTQLERAWGYCEALNTRVEELERMIRIGTDSVLIGHDPAPLRIKKSGDVELNPRGKIVVTSSQIVFEAKQVSVTSQTSLKLSAAKDVDITATSGKVNLKSS